MSPFDRTGKTAFVTGASRGLGPATVATVPMRRRASAAEMAGPAVFLAGEASSFMTGQVRIVDGGQAVSP
ncbi:MAG: SDR family oxidoreductase [Streptosporangiaceae bacterium]